MQIIEEQKEFNKLCSLLAKQDKLGFDFEFIREDTYIPILCLIQISCASEVYIVDPLKLNIKKLLPIFKSKTILKIFHSARQDLDVLYQNYKIVPQNLFDTQIAAGMLGFGDSISYAKLVKQICHKNISKDAKLANWAKRPLSKKELEYAASDVFFLFKIHDYLNKKIIKQNREEWLKEETNPLLDKDSYHLDEEAAWQRLKKSSNTPFYLNYLRAYAELREKLAQKVNKPRRNIIKDEYLVYLANSQPQSKNDITKDRILSKIDGSLIESILKASKKASKEKKELTILSKKHLNDRELLLVDLLKVLLRRASLKHKVAARFIATTEDLEHFVKDRKSSRITKGWRNDLLGKKANAILDNKMAITVKSGKIFYEDRN